jgi:hypothetical protein
VGRDGVSPTVMATASSTRFETSADSNLQEFHGFYLKDAPVHTAAATRVPLATMVETLFPSLTYTHVDDVLQVLRHNGNIKDEGWTAFEALCSPKDKRNTSKYEPHHSSQSEDVTFKSLERVFEQIQQANASLREDLIERGLPQGLSKGDTSNQASLVTLSIHGNALAGSWPNSAKPGGSIHLKKTSLPWPRLEEIDSKGNTYSFIDYADICLIIETKLCRTLEDVKYVRPTLNTE